MKFIALPVGRGDAFYAETVDGFRVLVDGGNSRKTLPDLFRRYTKQSGVDVLVCTHNDADHAEGIIGFLESDLDCKELWLPATWIDALQSLPYHARDTLYFLLERFREIEHERLRYEGGDQQDAAWQVVFPQMPEERTKIEIKEEQIERENEKVAVDNITLSNILDAINDAINEHLEMLLYFNWHRRCLILFGDTRYVLFSIVLKDISRLLKIALLAIDRGISIRCFRHAPQNAKPIQGYSLIPLSGKQVSCIPAVRKRTPKEFLYLAFLTTVNKQSLVFYLEAPEGKPGILFTADSDLEGVDLKRIRERSIVTAPHHGSKDNASVYSMFQGPMVWVRSDENSKRRPCSEYLHACGKRFCTICRNSNRQKQVVKLYLRKNSWVPHCTQPCVCI